MVPKWIFLPPLPDGNYRILHADSIEFVTLSLWIDAIHGRRLIVTFDLQLWHGTTLEWLGYFRAWIWGLERGTPARELLWYRTGTAPKWLAPALHCHNSTPFAAMELESKLSPLKLHWNCTGTALEPHWNDRLLSYCYNNWTAIQSDWIRFSLLLPWLIIQLFMILLG